MAAGIDRDNAVDGKVEGLAVRRADGGIGGGGGGELVVVQLDDAVDRVGVANHRQHDRVALVDDDLEDVRENRAR